MNMLDADRIRQPILSSSRVQLDSLEVFSEIESTNNYLLDKPAPHPGHYRVALADHQTAGRGRLDRQWVSPPATGLCLSIAYTFAAMPDRFTALTLAIGTSVVAALNRLQFHDIMLKWPNDIIARDCKLGGILTEVSNRRDEGVTVVIGVGLNVDFQQAPDWPVEPGLLGSIIDLRSCGGMPPDRSFLALTLLECLFDCMAQYEHDGFGAFQEDWQRSDWLHGKTIQVESPDGFFEGTAAGIDSDGALCVMVGDRQQRIISGSVRLASAKGDYL